MNTLISQLARDEAGFIISAELVVVATLLVIGLITGMACVQEALLGEYNDLSSAFCSLDQSFSYSGMSGCVSRRCGVRSWTAGSTYGGQIQSEEACFGLCTPLPRPECHDCVEAPCHDCTQNPCQDCTDGPLQPIPDAPGESALIPQTGPCIECPPINEPHPEPLPALPAPDFDDSTRRRDEPTTGAAVILDVDPSTMVQAPLIW